MSKRGVAVHMGGGQSGSALGGSGPPRASLPADPDQAYMGAVFSQVYQNPILTEPVGSGSFLRRLGSASRPRCLRGCARSVRGSRIIGSGRVGNLRCAGDRRSGVGIQVGYDVGHEATPRVSSMELATTGIPTIQPALSLKQWRTCASGCENGGH